VESLKTFMEKSVESRRKALEETDQCKREAAELLNSASAFVQGGRDGQRRRSYEF